MAITSVALTLTIFIMSPTILQVKKNLETNPIDINNNNYFESVDKNILSPYKDFLIKNTDVKKIDFFEKKAQEKWGAHSDVASKESIFILLPAFTLGQLESAFKIGFLLYLPFIAIDLIISNILLALGMMMVSPITISIPFKILLFILIGGWQKLFEYLLVVN
ncbi:Type III secretion inner membrane protein (YscR,SpaR,HrcR,EscR like protein) [Edwardsiella anguillarum ET080813]|uniref:Type III secretion inner membrane protein (YscR,SpaR,HrcR,EscR like protein) n=2 Tax=Edwardsiella anguillarum TaxID=1821960 RepID=A0A076LQC1_9GAMM|nr:Type III secretion inner membrane protein (YscR,SpaR,HrcR,EscR like protein) [Edwardsiella anguillarum ET080813]